MTPEMINIKETQDTWRHHVKSAADIFVETSQE